MSEDEARPSNQPTEPTINFCVLRLVFCPFLCVRPSPVRRLIQHLPMEAGRPGENPGKQAQENIKKRNQRMGPV